MKHRSKATLVANCLKFGVVLVAPFASAADEFVTTQCDYGDSRAIEQITGALVEIDRVLPQVPPEEERYLAAEYKAPTEADQTDSATQQVLNVRMTRLQARPLYYVWQVREFFAGGDQGDKRY